MRWQGNIIIKDWMSKKKNNIEFGLHDRAIFVWPWNENARTKQKQQTNRNRVIWFVYRTRHKLAWLLVGWANARVKKRHARELSRNIKQYFALTSYCNTIGQSNNSFCLLGFSLAGKRRVHVSIFSSIG